MGDLSPMFPIRDHNPSNGTPWVTWSLIALNILVFLGYWPLFSDPRALNWFFYEWAMTPGLISEGERQYTLITSMFLHGGWLHLGGNMLFLWIFGDNLEDELGHFGYLGFYLACGVCAALAQYIVAPYSMVPMVGASGAIAGVMGGYILLFPKARVDVLFIFLVFFKVFPLPAWIMLGLWFALQLFSGTASMAGSGGVAYWAHAGGFIVGFLMLFPLWLYRGGPDYWKRTHGAPPHPEARYRIQQSRIPTVRRRR